jgi:hypothetical protein
VPGAVNNEFSSVAVCGRRGKVVTEKRFINGWCGALALGLCLAGGFDVGAQSITGLDGSRPATEIVGDTGAPYENLFRPARLGGSELTPKVGPGRLRIPVPQLASPAYNLPLIERGFSPSDAELKIGRFYLDIRGVRGSILASDNIDASETRRRSGAISIVRMDVGMLFQATEGLRLATAGALVWLPFKSEAGINGFGVTDPIDATFGASPIARSQLSYEFVLGKWEMYFIDDFSVSTPFYAANLQIDQQFEGASFDEADTAGRYQYRGGSFGRGRRGATTARETGFNTEDLVFRNLATVGGTRMLPIDTAASVGFQHENLWYTGNVTGISDRDEAFASLVSQRENTRFKPFLTYRRSTDSSRKGWDNWVTGGFRGPATEYIEIWAEYGRFWDDVSDSSHDTWRLRLDHSPGPLTGHSIEYGRTVTRPERFLLEYYTYRLTRILGPYLVGEFLASKERGEALNRANSGFDEYETGVRLTFDLGPRTDLRLAGLYQRIENDDRTLGKFSNFIARLQWVRRHSETLDSQVIYQFEDKSTDVPGGSYYENLIIYTLSKSF